MSGKGKSDARGNPTTDLVAVWLAVIGDVAPFAARLAVGCDLPLGAVAEEDPVPATVAVVDTVL